MRLLIAAACAATLGAGPAWAEDFPQCFDKALLAFVDCPGYGGFGYDWTGWYIGGHAGYAEADLSGFYGADPARLRANDGGPDGFVGGGQIGFNWQADQFVFGVELDASFGDVNGHARTASGGEDNRVDASINSFGSLRARLGFPIDEIMPYVTGGVGLVDYEVDVVDVGDGVAFSEENTVLAGVIGGGVEIGLTQDITIRGEGLYYIIEDEFSFNDPSGGADELSLEDLWTLRGGVNLRF